MNQGSQEPLHSSMEMKDGLSLPKTLEDVILPLVGLLGILGNLWAGGVLITSNTKSTFHQSLKALVAVDLLLVISMVVESQKLENDLDNQMFIFLIPYCWNPFKNTVLTFQTFLIMSISAERYLAVKKPIQFKITKVKNSTRIHFLTFILPALVLAFIFNIPKFFETKLVKIESFNIEANLTKELYDYEITSLRLNPDYIFYYIHLARLVVMGILPFLSLLVINVLIFKKVKTSSRIVLSSLKMQRKQRKTRSHSIILMSIVVVYLTCNLPRVTLNLTEYLMQDDVPHWVEILWAFSNLCLTISSSVNYLIYMSSNKTRRTTRSIYLKLNNVVQIRNSSLLCQPFLMKGRNPSILTDKSFS